MFEIFTAEKWDISTNQSIFRGHRKSMFFPTYKKKKHNNSSSKYRAVGTAAGDFLLGMLAEKCWICCSRGLRVLLKKTISIAKGDKGIDLFILSVFSS